MTPDQIDAMRALQHLHLSEVARRLGVDRGVVARAARRHGITFNAESARAAIAASARRVHRKVDPERLPRLTHLSQAEAARVLGVTQPTLRHWMIRLGLEFNRDRGQRAIARAKHARRGMPKGVLSELSPSERADYDLLKRNRLTRVQALRAIGRDDLVEGRHV